MNQTTSELASFQNMLAEKYTLHCKCFEERNAEPLFHHFFSPDALWTGQGYPERRGEQELRPFFEEVTANYLVSCRSMMTFVNDDQGWDYVYYPVQPRNSLEKPWIFHVLFCWTKKSGEWKVNATMSYMIEADQ
ncbi:MULTISPECIES: hypothetical protein [unclassified Sphingobium]|nr:MULTISPECIES: hypothetical protein [unclassified Sphingobium]MBG6120432.1 hypothetical protein [Sphingobium sp. JAI105]TWD21031.1 hypothetical protein FB594_12616 [Sphingobium sp. AEW001]PSO10030.1 hypothetical protein C7E20_19305 [Sphingobium sp. AEW4]TWC98924.1 hypothetical protein FB595_12516 [Sphingobium sp. AEW010]TWD18403.1 hypothetical protein FB596_12616 [Sphingobium sp. AEW013]